MDSQIFDDLYRRGKVELELVPQGNLAARIRRPAPGWGGIYPTGYGTPLAEGKRHGNRRSPLRAGVPIKADFALIKAHRRPLGQLVYRKAARNFGPIMATAAKPPS